MNRSTTLLSSLILAATQLAADEGLVPPATLAGRECDRELVSSTWERVEGELRVQFSDREDPDWDEVAVGETRLVLVADAALLERPGAPAECQGYARTHVGEAPVAFEALHAEALARHELQGGVLLIRELAPDELRFDFALVFEDDAPAPAQRAAG